MEADLFFASATEFTLFISSTEKTFFCQFGNFSEVPFNVGDSHFQKPHNYNFFFSDVTLIVIHID